MNQWRDQQDLARVTGMIIPAYFSAKPADELVRELLWLTLGDCPCYLPLENIWVVVDGDARTARIVGELNARMQREHGGAYHIITLPENRGKLGAMTEGISALLAAQPEVEYVVIRDSDGDHAVADMPALLRTAAYLTEAYGHTRVIVVGARRSRHRPMGWVRGELEALLDRVTLDALAYHLAGVGRALNLSHCLGQGTVPDLNSGYKVYGREIARELFANPEPCFTCLSASDYWHYGPETMTIVEAMLAGVVFAETQRLTWDGQPTTSFGEFRHATLYGRLMAWVYARLDIPLEVAAQFYDNYVSSMLLRTTVEGRETLETLRREVLETLRAYRREAGPVPPARVAVPFV